VRDVFLVDLASDHLTVDDKGKREPLARWPDGSDPEGPPGPVNEMGTLRNWRGPLKDALSAQLLVPVRIQSYGRGSYPVVTIAGWHAAITPNASPPRLDTFADAVCKANGGAPMGLFAGLDRSLILRVRCPGGARWQRL
jgi:hypothetical protein